ncbi:hypothetical protein [Arhodomonas sp. AD133]|uniref:hypothetical protein n=1 Tax=Arhodomonas sp. AD133 TaxID=3415009 RepID=UPI003EBB4D9A
MKLEKAFAEDIELCITAQEADRHFEKGSIKSKFNFQCPGDKCDAPVTCANLDRPKNKRKRDPYYKVVGEHGPRCDLARDIKYQKNGSRTSSDIYSDSDEYLDDAFRLNLQPPSTRRPEGSGAAIGKDGVKGRARQKSGTESGRRKTQPTKTLSSLIDSYLNKESIIVQLPQTGVIDINDLFYEVNGQDVGELEDDFRVYWGKAWFNKKENGYSIVFEQNLTLGETTRRPTTYMPIDALGSSGFGRFNLSALEKIADNKPKMVFLLSETGPRVKNGYINIWCEGPEYLDYRLIDK